MQLFKPAKHDPTTDNDTLLVLRDDNVNKKVGSLYIADRAVELANTGTVSASADGSRYIAGDKVVFVKYAGAEIELNGITYVLLKEKEVQGTIRIVDSPTDIKPQTQADVDVVVQEALAKLSAQAQG